jgi:hypothetical protein
MEAEMSSRETSGEGRPGSPLVKPGEVRLEVVVVPISDIDRVKGLANTALTGATCDIDRGEQFVSG